MRLYPLILIVFLVMTNAVPAAAAGFDKIGTFSFTWEGIFTSGRLAALGGSDLADGSSASILINPSPLSGINGLELSYDHADFFSFTEFRTYAGSAEWNAWRLNFAVHELVIDDAVIRTAYNPEGTGETFDMVDRMTVMGVSYDLGRHFIQHPSLRWSVGGAWRHYLSRFRHDSSSFTDYSESSLTFDLGTTVGWKKHFQGGWTGITGALSWQNLINATISVDERSAYLPRPLRAGVTFETAFDWSGHQADFLKLLLAYTHCYQLGNTYVSDTDHMGLEAVVFGTLALRGGHSTRIGGNINSWGIGLMLDGRLLGPFTVHADMGEMGFNNEATTDRETTWGVRIGYDF